MSVTITITGENAEHARDEMRQLLGLDYRAVAASPVLGAPYGASAAASADIKAENEGVRTVAAPSAGPVTPGRERGKAAPGKQRRTAVEVAEDKALDEADAAGGTSAANISSGGEDRVDPADQEIGAEDTADEEADGIGEMDDAKVVRTHDDLRQLVGSFGVLFKNDMLAVQMAVEPAFKALKLEPRISTVPADKIAGVFEKMREIGADLEANPGKIAAIAKQTAAVQGKA